MISTFIAWCVRRPLIINMIMMLLVLLGLFSWNTGAIKGAPELNTGNFSITTLRPGASSEKMELSVTVPLEDELRSVDGVHKLKSNSAEGMSLIQVDADPNISDEDLKTLARDIQRAIDRAGSRLPDDLLEKPLLIESTSAHFPVSILMIYGDVPEQTLRELTRSLQDSLRELPGVRGVDRLGYRDREVHIQVDPMKLNRLGVSYDEIRKAIAGRNVTETGGSLASFVGEQDVVAVGEFAHPKDVAEVVVRSNGPGDYLRVSDLATITDGFSEPVLTYHKNGKPGIVLTVRGMKNASDVEVAQAVSDAADRFSATLPPGVSVTVVDDGAAMARLMINMLFNNALLGAILITIVLLFFYPWRSMVWVVAGIPIAVLTGLTLMPLFDIPYNTVSLIAIILMLGLLVDDAIVTSESIYQGFEAGLDPETAAIEGVAGIASPVITGALTTVFAMVPLLLVGGVDAKYMWLIPATVMLIIIASLFECLVLLPSHIVESLKRADASREKAAWFRHVQNFYLATLGPIIEHPRIALGSGVLIFIAGVVLVSENLRFESYPVTDATDALVSIEMPAGTPLAETEAVLNRLETRVREIIPAEIITGYFVVAGEKGSASPDNLIQIKGSNLGKLELNLIPGDDRDITTSQIVAMIQALKSEFSEVTRFNSQVINETPSVGSAIEVQVIAQDNKIRGEIAGDILGWLNNHHAVTDAWSNYAPGKSTIGLNLNYERMSDAGLVVADVTRALRVAYDGLIIEELQTVEERIRYRLQLADQYRDDIGILRSLHILNRAGEQVPLRNIADFSVEQGQSVIFHYAGRRAETVSAEINRDKTSVIAINTQLQNYIATQRYEQRYPGVRVRLGGELEAQAATADAMGGGLIIVLVSIFFLMVLLFNSLMQPLIVMAVIPLAFVAVLMIWVISDWTLGVAAIVGFLGLAGVLVNSSLVMVDCINKLHLNKTLEVGIIDAGAAVPGRGEILEGARNRLRPILITALTTSAGLGPAAYGIAGAHPSQTPMIMVMFWGGIVGSVTTLYTVPLLLALMSDLKGKSVSI